MNSLSIATRSPDEFAYHLMKGPGYMAVVGGEVVHIIKCVPVEVTVQHGKNCYAELQVSRNNVTYFLTPRTHILKLKGTQVACSALIPAYYRVGGNLGKNHASANRSTRPNDHPTNDPALVEIYQPPRSGNERYLYRQRPKGYPQSNYVSRRTIGDPKQSRS